MGKRGLVVLLFTSFVLVLLASLDILLGSVVETVGTQLTKSPVTIDSMDVSWSGLIHIQNLEIGNPSDEEFASLFALRAARVVVQVPTDSVWSDNIEIDEIVLDGVEMCWEGFRGHNHRMILENIQASADAFNEEDTPTEQRRIKKIRAKSMAVKQFRMTNTKLHLYGFGRKITEIELPDYEQQNIGGGADLAMGYIIKVIYRDILGSVISYVPTGKESSLSPEDQGP